MTPSVFSVLAVAPLLGLVFAPQEDTQKARVAVLSYATWKSRFNANPQVVGTKIDCSRRPHIVIAVMPRNFEFPSTKDASTTSDKPAHEDESGSRDSFGLR